MKLLTTLSLLLLVRTISAQDAPANVFDTAPRFPSKCELNDALTDADKQKCSDTSLTAYIKENLVYPHTARTQEITGTVKIKFTVDESGFIWEPAIVESVHSLLDKEALAVVQVMQDDIVWIPAEKDGQAIQTSLVIDVPFGPSQKKRFHVVEVMPRFPSSCERDARFSRQEKKQCADKEMLEFVYNNLLYPKEARAQGIEGTVVISFVIDELGRMLELEVSRSVHPLLDNAAMEVLRKMQEEFTWIPGEREGRPVAVHFNLPVRIKNR